MIYAFPPNYREVNIDFQKRFEEIVDKRTKIFYYNEENKEYRNVANFIDDGHLNKNGAKIFTSELIEYLKHN
ncbi:MAG: hypothetical protein M0D53_16200 [Flavobacterium sp. JAD_PAG50586_2]|nr:MAG: hypothetical protein M0D53_16200 [Flavobacterium sp. JAD_PAG50586_2]